jgi:hypothetical protein
MTVTLATMLTRCKRRIDREGGSFVADAEWYDYINDGLGELWDVLTQEWEDYGLTSTSISVVSGTDSYSLAAISPVVYKIRGIDITYGGNTYTALPFSFRERNKFKSGYPIYSEMCSGCSEDSIYRYQLLGASIKLIPIPTTAATMTVWYIPQLTPLVAGSSTDAAIPDTYLDFAIASACAKALIKEESDPTPLLAEKGASFQRISLAAKHRVAGEPKIMVDVRGMRSTHNCEYGGM